MTLYNVPETPQTRKDAMKIVYDEYIKEVNEFDITGKKNAAYRARAALLKMTKLAKSIRLDIQNVINDSKKK